ncbi:hypothetical protein SDC9_146220 [bioreactor metagenome]|uniref:Uncharacterized protein n=1 Tax=bioreactor metagenome TaxID=1076179 RepID=A0A645EB25_9ZZZZ
MHVLGARRRVSRIEIRKLRAREIPQYRGRRVHDGYGHTAFHNSFFPVNIKYVTAADAAVTHFS